MSNKYSITLVLLGFLSNAELYGQKKADFSNFVVTGDSLTAGYQNAQLIETSQVHGYANVIAKQKGLDLNLPLVLSTLNGGKPGTGGFPQITLAPGFAVANGFDTSVFFDPIYLLNLSQGKPTKDIGVPGFSLDDFVHLRSACTPDSNPIKIPIEIMAAAILNPIGCVGNPTGIGPTELDLAVTSMPTTAIFWIGSNDVLFSLLFAADPTPIGTFAANYHMAASAMARASRSLVLANIPDVTKTAYLISIPKLAAILKQPVPLVELVFGLRPGDMVTPYALPYIQTHAPGHLPDTIPPSMTLPIPTPIVIRAARILQIRADVIAYNVVIAIEALIHNSTLVDIYSLVNDLSANGINVNGKHLTTDFGGGLFSEDGVHPSNTGYAIIANEFIRVMNRSLDAGILPVSLDQVAKEDPLVTPPPTTGHIKRTHVSVEVAESLRAFGRR